MNPIDPLERTPLGQTRLAISRLGVGGGSLLNAVGGDGVSAVLAACWESGLRYFDTSPFYAASVSEQRFGAFLAEKPRDQFVLSTKVGRLAGPAGDMFDYTEAGVLASLEASMARLRVGRVDIVYIHDVIPELHGDDFERRFAEAMGGAYPALARMRARREIGAIGAGLRDPDICLRFARSGLFDCFMLAGGYTLLRHKEALREFMPYCVTNGISVIVAAPFNTGILATGAIAGARYEYQPATPDILDRVARIESACRRHGVTLAAAALQFPLRHPAVVSVVAGHQKPAEVLENLSLMREPIPEVFWDELRTEGLISANAPTV
jgi:D-threo-aldose 1-dehydrogenase